MKNALGGVKGKNKKSSLTSKVTLLCSMHFPNILCRPHKLKHNQKTNTHLHLLDADRDRCKYCKKKKTKELCLACR